MYIDYALDKLFSDELMHVGVAWDQNPPGRGSGRYEHGSGDNPYQRAGGFLQRVEEYKLAGLSEKDIAKQMNTTVTGLRAQISYAKHVERDYKVARCEELKAKGYSFKGIEAETGIPATTVQSLLNSSRKERMLQGAKVADFLRDKIDEKGIIDIGAGVDKELGVTRNKLDEAAEILKLDGYIVRSAKIAQATNPGQETTMKLLCPPGTSEKGAIDYSQVHSLMDYISYDGGETFKKSFEYPASMDPKRLKVRYAEDGGVAKDGVMEIRRDVPDLSLGNSRYAQVRILVGGTHYLKGMAVYSDGKDMPDGVDIIFNSNKPKGTPVFGSGDQSVLKKIKDDPENPFGSLIKEHGGQYYYEGPDGKQHLGLINKRAEERDWDEWSKSLPAQFLSKQPQKLIDKQLKLAESEKEDEFDKIVHLTNPTVKRKMLQDFADDCDTAAVKLKAAALPKQRYQVILPLTSIKDNEVYAPNYVDGETVALIRYPHGGTFEIPILKVNNKNKEGIDILGKNAADAIGINKNVANKLSGADFDGDTVMVIPCNSSSTSVRITSTKSLEGLKDFDPQVAYPYREGIKVLKKSQTQKQMGMVTNLITDMTIKDAPESEIAKAVRHSMVIVDAAKHELDWKRSEIENDIPRLKEKYQGHYDSDGVWRTGVSTLISRAKSPVQVPKRQGSPHINEDGSLSYTTAYDAVYTKRRPVKMKDPVTGKYMRDENGKYIYETRTDPNTGKTYTVYEDTEKTGVRTQKSTRMAEAKDARELVSGYPGPGFPQEEAYADYANKMKSLANAARKELISTGRLKYDKQAASDHKKEVDSLKDKLVEAERNAPREREAQRLAAIDIKYRTSLDPDLTKAEVKKIRQQAIVKNRTIVGAKRHPIDISDAEWEAIQAGAISDSTLEKILKYADPDRTKQLATPRDRVGVTDAQKNRIQRLKSSGFTNSEIAEATGVSVSTVLDCIKEGSKEE